MTLGHESRKRKTEIDRMVPMLSRRGGRGYQVREGTGTYGQCEAEVDPDSDLDGKRADYGAQIVSTVSAQLRQEFGGQGH